MKIFRVTERNQDEVNNLCCGVCNSKLQHGDVYRCFENNSTGEYSKHLYHGHYDLVHKRHFHTIENQFLMYLCAKCFNPEIKKEEE